MTGVGGGHDDDDDDVAYSNLAEGLENGWSAVVLTGSSMLDQNVDEIRMIPGTDTHLFTAHTSCSIRHIYGPMETLKN